MVQSFHYFHLSINLLKVPIVQLWFVDDFYSYLQVKNRNETWVFFLQIDDKKFCEPKKANVRKIKLYHSFSLKTYMYVYI